MKSTTLVLIAVLAISKSDGQVSSFGMGKEFKEIAGFGRVQSGLEGLQTYGSGKINGSQFFSEIWNTGSLTTTNNETISKDYLFIYDKVRQELYLKPKDSNIIVLADKSKIASFNINTDNPHFFQQAFIYDSSQYGNFFEVLVKNDNYTLLKLTKTTFEKANTTDLEKVKQGDFNDEFIDHFTYYIYYNRKPLKVSLNEFSLRKALKDRKAKMDEFFNLHGNDELTEQLLISLINYVNS